MSGAPAARGRSAKRWRAAVLTFVGVAAILALFLGPQLQPRREVRLARPALAQTSAEDAAFWEQRTDTLRDGESVSALLTRAGLETSDVRAVVAASALDVRRLAPGLLVTMRERRGDIASIDREVIFRPAVDRFIHVRRTADGWIGRELRLPWKVDTLVVAGTVQSSLYDALDLAAAQRLPSDARAELAWSLADIYEYRMDMSRDLQVGDTIRVLFERAAGPMGTVRIGRVLASRLWSGGVSLDALWFDAAGSDGAYFDGSGRAMRAGFLRSPLQFRRISSVFGRRRHPILGVWRSHRGTDYAARSGTPVRAVGDGVVAYAGRRAGYGNVLEVRHRNGFLSRYAHLRGFAKGSRAGRRVVIGQTIGYVGATGLATGPHLHFEILVNGSQRDPRLALKSEPGTKLPEGERTRFDSVRLARLAALETGSRPSAH